MGIPEVPLASVVSGSPRFDGRRGDGARLTMENPSPGSHDASQDGGAYDSAGTEYVDEIPQICAGQEYCFDSTVSWGDGICC